MPSNTVYRQIGDAAHLVSLTSALVFCYLAGRRMNNPNDHFFDDSWKENGFCVTNRDVPYWNSHDVCMYVDTVLAATCAALYFLLHKAPGMDEADDMMMGNIPGILVHGLIHGLSGAQMRQGTYFDAANQRDIDWFAGKSYQEWAWASAFRLLFWFGLLRAIMRKVDSALVLVAAAAASWCQLFTPQLFGFTYVQTVLLVAFSMHNLLRSPTNKNFEYAMFPIMVSIPLTVIGWLESTNCTAFVKDKLYGHVAYDAYIPISIMAWYGAAYIYHQNVTAASAESKAKKLQ